MHIAANAFNDYFDWTSGTDPANNDYLMPYTGGSRSIELGLITEKGLFRVAVAALMTALLMGLPLLLLRGPILLLLRLVGTFCLYFYTAPPLRLAARYVLGELAVGLCFGPLMVAGAVYALTGVPTAADFLVGLRVGLLTAAILWINQFPDVPADAATGKRNMIVVLGRRRARWGYVILLVGAFGIAFLSVALNVFPAGLLLVLGGVPLAVHAFAVLYRHYGDRTLIRANSATIQLHLLSGILLVVGLILSRSIAGFS